MGVELRECFPPTRLGLLLPEPGRGWCCCAWCGWCRMWGPGPEALALTLCAGDRFGDDRVLPLPLLWWERGERLLGPRTSLSEPLTISTNWRHLSMKSRLGLRSSSPGYSCWVSSMASPIRPASTNFWMPAKETHVSCKLHCNADTVQQAPSTGYIPSAIPIVTARNKQ